MTNVLSFAASSIPRQETVLVTPQMAAEWLVKNSRNRAIVRAHLSRLKRDMLAGLWRFNPQPISFGTDGTLLDGQHRLTAIAETGVSVMLVVWRDVPPDARTVMDQGVMRRLSDVAEISKVQAATASLMLRGLDSGPIATMSERVAFYNRFATQIDFAIRICPANRAGLKRASVKAAVARAATGHVAHDLLERFARIFESGMPESISDATVIRLRDKVMASASGGGASDREIYGSTEVAIRAFEQGRILSRIFPSKVELFDLPQMVAE